MPEVRPRRQREPGGSFSPCTLAVRLDHKARCVSGVFKFMPKRMTIIDGVLRVIGGATILLSLLVTAAMFVTWSTPFPMLFKDLGIEPSLRLEAVVGALCPSLSAAPSSAASFSASRRIFACSTRSACKARPH